MVEYFFMKMWAFFAENLSFTLRHWRLFKHREVMLWCFTNMLIK